MKDTTAHCLLTEPIFTLTVARGRAEQSSLPGVLARLSRGEEIEFLGLQAHQQHPWHAFLVQLAALALVGDGERGPIPEDEAGWERRLLALSEEQVEPWCLVVEDLTKPAFMQPPVPEGSLATLKNVHRVPATLDVLVTAKGHDVKTERMAHAAPQHWVFTLITLQTFEGYSGRKHYGIVRMNGGFASRPCVSVAPDLSWSRRFQRDLPLLRRRYKTLVEDYGLQAEGGHKLLWLLPWDGSESISIDSCAPFFIEVCRRVRLIVEEGRLVARAGTSMVRRIYGASETGDVGDLWSPVRKKDQAVLTVSDSGFTYRMLPQILFGNGDFMRSPASEVGPQDRGELLFLARVLVRGQGKTGGYRERVVPIPPRALSFMAKVDDRSKLAKMAEEHIKIVAEVQRRVLRPALCALLQGGNDKLDLRDEGARPWIDRHDALIDRIFFDQLWLSLDFPPEEAKAKWTHRVLDLAQEQFEAAIEGIPHSTARRLRAVARAEGLFHGSAHKQFPEIFASSGGTQDGSSRADIGRG